MAPPLPSRAARPPVHPRWVLLAAILLPGFGHTLMGMAPRGLVMQLFMVCLGLVTWQLSTPQTSLVGRLAGGLFIYAVSIMDAYRLARLRWDAFGRRGPDVAG
jgi:hypothetical protein